MSLPIPGVRENRIQCPECEGSGKSGGKMCRACKGRRMIALPGCPGEVADAETFEALGLARHAAAGSWPVAGGTLDQAEAFLQLTRWVEAEEATLKAER